MDSELLDICICNKGIYILPLQGNKLEAIGLKEFVEGSGQIPL